MRLRIGTAGFALSLAMVFASDAPALSAPVARLERGAFDVRAEPRAVVHEPVVESSNSSRLSAGSQLAIERLIDHAIEAGEMPGCVVIIGNHRGLTFRRAFGLASVEPVRRAMHEDAVFDLASVTKAVATATSIAALVEDGKLAYADSVARFVPAFAAPDKRAITIRQLLTHTSGLPAVNASEAEAKGIEAALLAIASARLVSAPGEKYLYSDLGFIVLGEVVHRASGVGLDRYARRRLFQPLGLDSTRFVPPADLVRRAVPTEKLDSEFLRGVVHDPRARALGGVAGHAGLFASADDLARFSRLLLGRGELDGVRVLRPETVTNMTRPIEISGARVALGWDAPDEPERSSWSPRSFGHEGFTGTSLWIDPERDLFVVFLSSRLHPDHRQRRGRIGPLAQAIRAEAAHAVVEKTRDGVVTGIDVLAAEDYRRLSGSKVALVTHAAARNRDGTRTIDLLFGAPNLEIVTLLAPEHGLDVQFDNGGGDGTDVRTGLPVRSLWPLGRRPTASLLSGADTVVVDLQDAGVRFYTYEAVLRDVLEAAALTKKRVVVLDRPNPLGGERVEGPVSDAGPPALIDPFPMPIRHGLTLGELARLFAGELALPVRLEVVRMQHWQRSELFEQTGLAWFDPSPNLRSPHAALLYPGVALFETTNLSVGRGTPTPFEVLGAPWLSGSDLERRLKSVPGVRVRAVAFVPDSDKFQNERCSGVRFDVTDPEHFEPIQLAFALAAAIRDRPEWTGSSDFRVLLRNQRANDALFAGSAPEAIADEWASGVANFVERRKKFLIYD